MSGFTSNTLLIPKQDLLMAYIVSSSINLSGYGGSVLVGLVYGQEEQVWVQVLVVRLFFALKVTIK